MTTTCDHPVSPESRVLQHCTKHGHTMYGRCCLKTLSHHNATVQEQQHDFYILGYVDTTPDNNIGWTNVGPMSELLS